MRVLALSAASLFIAGLGCGSHAGPCEVPTGCARAERVNDTCGCAEWQIVSVEPVPLPYVFIDVRYVPVGTASVFRYGETWEESMVPQSASRAGPRVRAIIRRADGSEQIARLGTLDPRSSLERASDTALRIAAQGGVWTLSTNVDVPSSNRDFLTAWVNPSVTVATTYVGEKLVNWSWEAECFQPPFLANCIGPEYMVFAPRLLRGEVFWTAAHETFLATLGDGGRDALLAFDPRAATGSVAFPRYQRLFDVGVNGTGTRELDATWAPCEGSTDPDATLDVLAETEVPFGEGDTFILQYGVQAEATCARQQPGLVVGTVTPDCSFRAAVLVDRLGGTLLMEPSAVTATCTRT